MKPISRRALLPLCAALVLLCALMVLPANAATAGTLTVKLTWDGVTGSPGVSDGDAVNKGYAALTEDGAQIPLGLPTGDLAPISGGQVSFTYAFDPSKTYAVEIQEVKDAPYYDSKTIPLTSAQISAVVSTGLDVTDTVKYIEWSRPIKVLLLDTEGNPAPVGTPVTVTMSQLDYQVKEVTKPTDAAGMAVFYDYSYDPADPSMCNIFDNRLFASTVRDDDGVSNSGDETVIARFYDLSVTGNVITLDWPTVKVSGTVSKTSSTAGDLDRVAAYYDLASVRSPLWTEIDPYQHQYTILTYPLEGAVYYTQHNSSGNYSLWLPKGIPAKLCSHQTPPVMNGAVGDVSWRYNVITYDYVLKASQHFIYLRNLFLGKGFDGPETMSFMSLACDESAAVPCIPYTDLTGMDLAVGRMQYTLKANLLVNGTAYGAPHGEVTFYRKATAATSASASDLHSGPLSGSLMTYNTTNGLVNKPDVTLAPGDYIVSLKCTDTYADQYSGISSLNVTITNADINDDGIVDLGTLDFAPVPKVYHPTSHGSGASGSGTSIYTPTYTPGPGDPGHAYLNTRMDAVADPAYPGASYQITLTYVGFHTNAAISDVGAGQVTVKLPVGVSVNNPGGMTVGGSAAAGYTLTESFSSLPTSEAHKKVFSVKIEDSAVQNYYLLLCESYPDRYGNLSPENTSSVTLQRLKINLSAPRLVLPGQKFTVFGDITGAGETGVDLYDGATWKATGAKKGFYYYFKVLGQLAGTYNLHAETTRGGVPESSAPVTVEVAPGLPQVDDVHILYDNDTYPKNPNFNMVYFTGFSDHATLAGPSFEVHLRLSGVPIISAVSVDVMGLNFPAHYDSASGEWIAEISGYTGYGDFDIMANIGPYTTQVGRLMLLF